MSRVVSIAVWAGLGLSLAAGCVPAPAARAPAAPPPAQAPSDVDPTPPVPPPSWPSPQAPPFARAAVTATTALTRAARALAAGDGPGADSALARWEADPDREPSLAPYAAVLRAESALARADDARGLAALEGVDAAAPTLAPEVARLRARALAERDPAAAAELLVAGAPTATDLERAAHLFRRAGRAPDARAAADRLLVELPASPEARTLTATLSIAALQARLGSRAIVRVERLLEAHDNERARDEAQARASDPALACRALYVEGKALRKLRLYRAAVEVLPKAVEACRGDGPRLRAAQLLEIQVRAIRGEVKALRARTEALLAADATHRYGDDALLLLAQQQERSGDEAAARATYRRIVEAFPAGDQAGAAAWGLAFEAIQREAWAEAEPWLEKAIGAAWVEPVDRARARYWLARAREAQKGTDVCARFHEAATADGLGFFTWLTLTRLEASDPACARALREALAAPAAFDSPTIEATLGALPAFARARALLAQVPAGARDPGALRLLAWARDELRAVRPTPEQRVALALAFDALDAHKDAQDLLRAPETGLLDRPPSAQTWAAWRAAYSRAFAEEIRAAATAESFDPLLLTALAREESTFDPQIVSWAGAVGLAQLMPGTAITAHFAVAKKKLDLARLTEPELNLRLGARVLADGLRDFSRNVPLALGAYNGGPGLVLKSLPAKPTDFDLWCETIPVRETRRYIQRVTGTWGIYRFLYGEGADRFITLPARIPGPG